MQEMGLAMDLGGTADNCQRKQQSIERTSKCYGGEGKFCMNSDVRSGAIGRQQMEKLIVSNNIIE